MDNDPPAEDSKPSARSTTAGNADATERSTRQAIVPERSEQKEEVSDSRSVRRNTSEFSHALNHLPTENIPSYTREFDNILTLPEKVRRLAAYASQANVIQNTVLIPFTTLSSI